MASIDEVYDAIDKVCVGFNEEVLKCIEANKYVVEDCIREQLYSGQRGNDKLLTPSYDNDPYFLEDGPWKNKADKYKAWKNKITPPESSYRLNLPPRPAETPNLFITGAFHDSIHASRKGDMIDIFTSGFRDGPTIERKYGENIFEFGSTAKEYFNKNILEPWLRGYFSTCGL